MSNQTNLCSVEQLQKLMSNANTRVLDASWYMPAQQVDVAAEYNVQHIVGAHFFHIDLVCDQSSKLPHMLPTEAQFANVVGDLGIDNQSTVVVYDSAGLFSAARVWWMFKVFGHHKVFVLDGGLPEWLAASGQTSNEVQVPKRENYNAKLNSSLVASREELIRNCETKDFRVLDARSQERFFGRAAEPRIGLPSGHMPESVSLPFNLLLEKGKLKSVPQLRQLFSEVGVTKSTPIVTSCGSGVTAAIITLALAEVGFGLNRLYDGAWAEWGSANDTAILDRANHPG